MKKVTALMLIGLLTSQADASCPSATTILRFKVDSLEVTDLRTKLVWKRCSEGQTLSGSLCIGEQATFSHEQALKHAARQTGWRVPNIKELHSLADKGCQNPAIDSTAFPSTASGGYWSSTPSPYGSASGWNVHFANGGVNEYSPTRRSDLNYLRLVRDGR